jgi:hypothetical protein
LPHTKACSQEGNNEKGKYFIEPEIHEKMKIWRIPHPKEIRGKGSKYFDWEAGKHAGFSQYTAESSVSLSFFALL